MKRAILMTTLVILGTAGSSPWTRTTGAETNTVLRPGTSLATVSALDQHGQPRALRSVVGTHGALVTFLRSADWCPSCKVQLVQLEAVRDRLAERGYGLAALTIDEPPVLRQFGQERRINFPLLSGRRVISELGLEDSRFDQDPQRRGAPHPAVYLLDEKLEVVRAFPEGDRHTVGSMLAHIGVRGDAPAREAETRHLTVRAWSSDSSVPFNRRFAVVVDVAPKPEMHVYAPGNASYKQVRLILTPAPGLDIQPLQFPKAGIYTYKPLNEQVKVYSGPFRLVQEVMIRRTPGAPAVEPQTVTLRGELEYQACDDIICYPVTRLPLSWSLRIE